MKKTSLQEQTSDPRWQRKRLEILERDEWTCKQCGDTETTLTVHHKSYRMEGGKFVDYWDYENSELITLCNPCHEKEEKALDGIKKYIFYDIRDCCDDSNSILYLVGIANSFYLETGKRATAKDLENIWKGGFKNVDN